MNVAMDFSKTHVVHQWKHERPLIACRISPDGQQVVSSSEDSTLQLWKVPSGEKVTLAGHESWVHAMCYSPDSQRLVSGGCDGKIVWWDAKAATATPVRSLDAHNGWIRALAISPDGQLVASVGNDKTVRLWSMSTGEKISEWPAHDRHIYSVIFHPNGNQLVTGDLLGVIHVWNIAEKKLERSFDGKPLYSENKGQNAEYGGIRTLAYHTQRNELIAGGTHKASNPFGAVHEPLVLRFGWDDGALKKTHACEGSPGGLVWRTQWLSDGTAIAVSGGSTGGILLFFGDGQEKELHRFMLPSLARDMDVHSDSNMVATAHYDMHLRISIMNA
jgi:WD40 repeat protein